ncbi:MAG: hypothetical protein IV100_34710 [Myxococcales bacterium]|nr:hypothetical protein [Myxococcales bacterium]
MAVLASDPWAYVQHVIRHPGGPTPSDASAYWVQCERFFASLRSESYEARSLHLYYMILNGCKSLLSHRYGLSPSRSLTHGVKTTVDHNAADPSHPSNWRVAESQQVGVLQCITQSRVPGVRSTNPIAASTEELLKQVVWTHRAWTTAEGLDSKDEWFLPVAGKVRLEDLRGKPGLSGTPVRFRFRVSDRVKFQPQDMPTYFALDPDGEWVGQDFDWGNIQSEHASVRRHIDIISSREKPSYYVRKSTAAFQPTSQIALNFMLSHALSTLARYHPRQWSEALDGRLGWVIKEYLTVTPAQMLGILAGEISGRIVQIPYSALS